MNNTGLLAGVSKTFLVEAEPHRVLNGVDLALDLQGITVILGKSGCGKTTLLRLLAGLETPSEGTITFFNGQGEVFLPKVGMVFQESRLMPWLSVMDNILIHQKKHDHALGERMIQLMGLEGFAQSYPSELSGGMAHRVAIARALAFEPDLLLMDEPFAALDYFTRIAMQNEVIRIWESTKKGVLFVTHNVDEALILANRIIVLKKGEAPVSYEVAGNYPREISEGYYIDLKRDILNLLGK